MKVEFAHFAEQILYDAERDFGILKLDISVDRRSEENPKKNTIWFLKNKFLCII